jgi:hypothetical protein
MCCMHDLHLYKHAQRLSKQTSAAPVWFVGEPQPLSCRGDEAEWASVGEGNIVAAET